MKSVFYLRFMFLILFVQQQFNSAIYFCRYIKKYLVILIPFSLLLITHQQNKLKLEIIMDNSICNIECVLMCQMNHCPILLFRNVLISAFLSFCCFTLLQRGRMQNSILGSMSNTLVRHCELHDTIVQTKYREMKTKCRH